MFQDSLRKLTKENYESWRLQMRAILIQCDQWEYVFKYEILSRVTVVTRRSERVKYDFKIKAVLLANRENQRLDAEVVTCMGTLKAGPIRKVPFLVVDPGNILARPRTQTWVLKKNEHLDVHQYQCVLRLLTKLAAILEKRWKTYFSGHDLRSKALNSINCNEPDSKSLKTFTR
ncbi:hypothetical protein WH47_02449 [Habropoda laboriosa]|uniref:DUF4219 domain-containing protein n=1 Tax=Habropoda laboriosa TaxID=597456 RepID=A0A0L7QWM2_9HYME|nr:hypothetical protein WH47_02449 [Habropoda laboriosa]